jgi:hypothetical protein
VKLMMIDGSSLCVDAPFLLMAETARTQDGKPLPGKSKVTTQAGPLPLPVNAAPDDIWEQREDEIARLIATRGPKDSK